MQPASPSSPTNGQPAENDQADRHGFPANLLLLIAVSLFFCRMFVPAESASAGDTSLMVLGWTLFTSLACWLAWRERKEAPLRFDGLDILLAGLCLAPVISTIMMFFTGGQLRFALNMSWEWIGCFLTVFWLRRLNLKTGSPLLLILLISMGVSQSGLGLYQNLVSLPAQQAHVMPLVEKWREFKQEESQELTTSLARQRQDERKNSLERLLVQEGIPLDPHAQEVFLQRLHSSEPFGSFALANTLAGLLAVCLILLAAWLLMLMTNRQNFSGQTQVWFLSGSLLILPIAYCLLLTKSRTAWAGLIAGSAYLLILFFSRQLFSKQSAQSARWGKIPGIAFLLIVLLVGLGIFSGNLDREVLTQATLSLKYRLEYWQSSWLMLQDHWLLGTGPGNFRQNYLAYKLPESSEEILDPHNLWFDAWSGGGLLALLSLGGLALLFLSRLGLDVFHSGSLRSSNNSGSTPDSNSNNAEHPVSESNSVSVQDVIVSVGLSVLFALLLVSPEISPLLETLLILGVFWGIVSLLLRKLLLLKPSDSHSAIFLGLTSATLALFVHLLGAGGYSMPVIFQLLMLLGIGYQPLWTRTCSFSVSSRLLPVGILAGLFLSAAGFWLVVRAELAAVHAQANLQEARSLLEVKRVLEQWSQIDPFSPDPWLQLGNTLEHSSRAATIADPDSPPESSEAFQAGIQRDPRSYQPYRFLAQAYTRQFRQSQQFQQTGSPQNSKNLNLAIESQTKAISRYPQQPILYAELADYLHLAGKEAEMKQAIEKTLQLQKINQDAGHPDRLLPEPEIERLKNLLPAEKKTNGSASET